MISEKRQTRSVTSLRGSQKAPFTQRRQYQEPNFGSVSYVSEMRVLISQDQYITHLACESDRQSRVPELQRCYLTKTTAMRLAN